MRGARRTIVATMGLALLWTLAVMAVVFAEVLWFARPAIPRGDPAAIEQHLVQRLRDATADRRIGSAVLVLVHAGRMAAEHGVGVANA